MLDTDSSDVGTGAVLSQEVEGLVVAHASRAFQNKNENNETAKNTFFSVEWIITSNLSLIHNRCIILRWLGGYSSNTFCLLSICSIFNLLHILYIIC